MFALSRRRGNFPQWDQSAIIDALPSDIEYRWIAAGAVIR
jgi:hypothetical protein